MKSHWAKRSLLLSASACLFPTFASAGDWNGPWIGFGGGYGIANEEYNFGPGPALAPLLGGASANVDVNGIGNAGGLFTVGGGYDHTINNKYVIGAFIDYDFDDFDSKAGINIGGAGGLGLEAHSKIENQLSIGARAGFLATPSTLFFVDAGYARVDMSDIKASISAGGVPVIAGVLASVPTLDGYFVGGGVETQLGGGFSLKGEYRYTDVGPDQITLLPGTIASSLISATVEPKIQTGRVSLNYRFGDHSASDAEAAAPSSGGSWTGVYLGFGGGLGASKNDLTFKDKLTPVPGSLFSANIDGFGFDGGTLFASAGYDKQIAPRFVAGAFVDGDYTNIKNQNSLTLNIPGAPGIGIAAQTDARIRDIFMLGGRLGYLATPDTMIFGSGGYANVNMGATTFNAGITVGAPPPIISATGKLIDGDRLSGFFLGGGVETRLTNHLSLKAEYRYIDAGSDDVNLLPTLAPIVNNFVSTQIDPVIQMGRISINYRFGGPDEAAPLK